MSQSAVATRAAPTPVSVALCHLLHRRARTCCCLGPPERLTACGCARQRRCAPRRVGCVCRTPHPHRSRGKVSPRSWAGTGLTEGRVSEGGLAGRRFAAAYAATHSATTAPAATVSSACGPRCRHGARGHGTSRACSRTRTQLAVRNARALRIRRMRSSHASQARRGASGSMNGGREEVPLASYTMVGERASFGVSSEGPRERENPRRAALCVERRES
eukprot:COSAG06_NODE_4151_length_4523_cov_5.299729_5_plen_218_part_00